MRFLRKHFLPPVVFILYWLWTKTWRLKIYEAPEFTEARLNGRVIFSFWHGDELVMLYVGARFHTAAMTSTSDDGELINTVAKYLGYGTSRGSSTRGGVRALIGMLSLMKEGYNASVAIDGPKGPRFKAKPGIWSIAKHSGAPIIPIGVAKKSALVMEKSWNKAFLPWPFTKVVVSFGKPLVFDPTVGEDLLCKTLEDKMLTESKFAQTKILSALLLTALFLGGCVSTGTYKKASAKQGLSVLESSVHMPLVPKGKWISGKEPAIVTYVAPGSVAEKYGMKPGDKILKLNGSPIESFLSFEKKIKLLPPQIEIEYQNGKNIGTKNILLKDASPRLGALASPQGVALIKHVSPTISFMNKGPVTVYSSVSVDESQKNLFVNLILESVQAKGRQVATLKVYNKKTGKLIHRSNEAVDAMGSRATLLSQKVPLNFSPSEGVVVGLSLEKQQFAFEFQ